MNIVLVKSVEKKFDKFEKNTKSSVLKILKILKKNNKIIEIYLIGNIEMRRLNREFRGKDKTTNILSFDEPIEFFSVKFNKNKLGEIYLNILQTTDYKLQTTSIKKNLFSIDELLIHGILHLLGYNHLKKMDSEKMEKMERRLIGELVN
ncbi:rRNA maturation RNase YbeY [Candidatus Wolfebacteria bacterium CG10_big_fil_rev_8_21_14_0_10_31_9]|uniref:Endoribonuclease YbeY n=1 Tax=Candidatus Wolfebacteria bacterium CG10_big_fil_rev_8_21_14_0_10_31_9 TaxID=1975070 RepID=A0A2H0RC58_9BACT|nr:MAG: rRNA maturation RNase YbeY [Candidatus Wolfebacteria bacterium CG10_big_fil_rev_8_21_14_0_10_31_9]